jgi:hypothetical protein
LSAEKIARSAPDAGKPSNPKDAAGADRAPLDLTPSIAEIEQSLAQLAGKLKYGAWNWRHAGVRASVYVAAAKRHLARWMAGEERDAVEDTHHLASVMACMAIVIDAQAAGKLVDDRPPSTVDLDAAMTKAQERAAHLIALYGGRKPRDFSIGDTDECCTE